MKLQLDKGAESTILTVFILDDTATDGSGLAALDHTSGITGGYVRMGSTGVALTCDEDVTVEGTYQAPTAVGKVRIGTPANMESGTYELHFHNNLFLTGAESVFITLSGAADMAPLIIEVQLITPIADQVWDELLTGATHNLSTSAGRRLRALEGGGTYENGSIWIDTLSGVAGTEDFENGTSSNPVDSLTDAKVIALSLGITRFTILSGSSITLDDDLSDYGFFGHNWTLALGNQTLDGIYVEGAHVSGLMAGTGTYQEFKSCQIGATSVIAGTHFNECGIENTITVIEAGDYFFDRCHSGIAGNATWVFDFGTTIGNTNLNIRNYSGGVQLECMNDTGTDTASIEGQGQIIEGTCTGGAVSVRGCFTVTDITNITMTEGARIDTGQIATAAGAVLRGTSTASSTTGKVYVQAGDTPAAGTDDDYNGLLLVVWSTADKSGAVNIRNIDDYDDSDPSFTVSPALSFTPGDGDLVEIWRAGSIQDLSSLTGGFATTSPNRLIDHLRSTMSKGAVTPASLGTYNPATDSQEKISENLTLALGAGFQTSTDSLKEIRDAIDTLVAPNVVSASSLSGSGFLSDVVSLIRKATDEPSNAPKYTDGDIVEMMQAGMDAVLTDILINTDHPIIVRYTIALEDGVQYYILPPNVAEVLRIAKINSSSGLPEYEIWPGSHMNPGGHGWKLEGNVLRLLRDWDSTDSLEIMYIPNSEPLMHKGTAEGVTATTITLMATPTDGTLGTRPNEYTGMLCRIISSTQNYQEERMITGYDLTTRIATLAKAWDTTPTGTIVYEVVPIYSRTIKHVVALRTSIDLLAQEGNAARMATLNQNYAIKLSAMRRQLQKMEGRFPHHFDGDTWDNTNRGGFYGA